IGSAEIFSKTINVLNINLHWHDLPEKFSEYYKAYNCLIHQSSEELDKIRKLLNCNNIKEVPYRYNQYFTVDIEVLKNKTWLKATEAKAQIFNKEDVNFSPKRTLQLIDINENPQSIPNGQQYDTNSVVISEDDRLTHLEDYNIHTDRGFIRLSLNTHFGHRDFKKVLSRIVKENNQPGTQTQQDIPENPYTPTLHSVSLDYEAEKFINDGSMRNQSILHVHPFGSSPHTSYDDTPYLLPQYSGEGSLFIGLEDLKAPCELSILFQMEEGTADPYTKLPHIDWYYLSDNQWYKFKTMQVLTDSTNGFNKPGVVTLSIPKDISDNNTILPSGKYWIQAKADVDALGCCKVLNITTQAAQLTFTDHNNDANHLAQPLAPHSIKKLKSPIPAIKKIHQPYASFGGKTKELDKDFYVRISERLRHKGRAVSQWDFEHLALDKFPELYKVKCFKHTSWDNAYDPGSVLILAIPDVRNSNLDNKFKPYTSIDLLDQVSKYIKTLCPPNVKVDTQNPLYEEIQVSFLVKFIDGINKGLYEKQLQEEIKQFLSPWA
ncbi:MAG: baseplate J/gp47 family protein, partial [Bacteroidales bacterium]|nr:baseplate J/gp47 family protein [Bacteroidales bacterium]